MKPYKSKSGKKSGVTGYQAGRDFITIQFNYSGVYTYSYRSAGKEAVEEMKALAEAQKGLSTYISQNDPAFE